LIIKVGLLGFLELLVDFSKFPMNPLNSFISDGNSHV
jgi:hypothetical protein